MRNNSTLSFQVANANCGNDRLGLRACDCLISEALKNGIMIINCQEVRLQPAVEELRKYMASHKNLELVQSDLRQTKTKFSEFLPWTPDSGMATIVLYDKNLVKSVSFDKEGRKEAVGKNTNKGATVNSLTVYDNNNQKYTIQTVAGHLESNKQDQRVDEWVKIREFLNPQVQSWDALVKKIPEAVVSGYDANTRSVVPKESTPASTKSFDMDTDHWHDTKILDGRIAPYAVFSSSVVSKETTSKSPKTFDKVTNLWHDTKKLDGRIAPFVLAPLGDQVHSAEDTYKFKLNSDGSTYKSYKEDKRRAGYVNAGSLDFVTIQNNTVSPVEIVSEGKRYQNAHKNIPIEVGSDRDHNVIVSPPFVLENQVDSFSKVKNHICKQLKAAAPDLVKDITKLTDCPESRATLLGIYKEYLAPEGLLNKGILACESSSLDVQSPLTGRYLSYPDVDACSVTSSDQPSNDSLTSSPTSISSTHSMREDLRRIRSNSSSPDPTPTSDSTPNKASPFGKGM